MYGLSQAKQAKIYAPVAFQLDRFQAQRFWNDNHFVDKDGNVINPVEVSHRQGILSVIFPDGSILHHH